METGQSCGINPGHACLNCPFPDCICGDVVRISREEAMMTQAGTKKRKLTDFGALREYATRFGILKPLW